MHFHMAKHHSFNCEKPMNENHFEAALNISIILAETKRMTAMVGCLPIGTGLTRLEYA